MLILLLWGLVVAYQDLRYQRIDNLLVYPYLVLAALWLLVNTESLAGASPTSALAGAVFALALTIPGHIKGILGGGDVKLMAAVGLTLGGMATLVVTAIAALLFLIWAVIAALLPAGGKRFIQRYTPGLISQQGHVAYGPFIVLALLALQSILLLI